MEDSIELEGASRHHRPSISPASVSAGGAEAEDAEAVLVREIVARVSGRIAYSDSAISRVVTLLVEWSSRTAGLQLDPSTVLHRRVVERFVAEGLRGRSEATRGNMRSQLRRVGEVVLEDSRGARPRPLRSAPPAAPYSQREMTALRSWAGAQTTPARRANARILLALGAGAGLTAREVGEIRAGDVDIDQLGVVLTIGEPRARIVPVTAEWEDEVASRSRSLDAGRFLFRENRAAHYGNLITNFVARSPSSREVPQTQRLRATWVVQHLHAGTPVKSLLRAAGVDSLEAFTRYLPWVDDLPLLDFRRRLRAES